MKSLHQQTGKDCVKPDHITYTSVLHSFARSKNHVDVARAEELLDVMEQKARNGEIRWPNASAYNALISIYNKHGSRRDVGEKAEAVIDRMDNLYNSGIHFVRADSIIFCAGKFQFRIFLF
jgi:hypothetical protein